MYGFSTFLVGAGFVIGFAEGAALTFGTAPQVGLAGGLVGMIIIEFGTVPLIAAGDTLGFIADVFDGLSEFEYGESNITISFSRSTLKFESLSVTLGPETRNNIFYSQFQSPNKETISSTVLYLQDMFALLPHPNQESKEVISWP